METYAKSKITEIEFNSRSETFPINTPPSYEAYLYRKIFILFALFISQVAPIPTIVKKGWQLIKEHHYQRRLISDVGRGVNACLDSNLHDLEKIFKNP